MAPLPSRKTLESMKRTDLQRLCKDYGVKANLKSEALIDLLIDTAKPVVANTPTRRSVSTRHSSRAGPSRLSSIVIHGSDEEEEDNENDAKETFSKYESDAIDPSQHEPTPPLATRTRKGKEQTRLGVGRPVVAGGSGPRAVTKSLSLTKSKRGKGSRSMKPSEATILEEDVNDEDTIHANQPDDGSPQAEQPSGSSAKRLSPEASLESLAIVDKHVADALRPLHEQIKSMKSELELMQALKTEVQELKTQIDEMGNLREKVESLTATVRDLRKEADEAAALHSEVYPGKDTFSPHEIVTPSTPKAQSPVHRNRLSMGGFGIPPPSLDTVARRVSGTTVLAGSPIVRPHPGIAPSMLGKRHRDSTTSEAVNDIQEDSSTVNSVAQHETKPLRKRAKLASDDEQPVQSDTPDGLEEEQQEAEGSDYAPRGPSFRVFSGLEVSPMELMEPPPPTEHLPDFFTATSPLGSEVPIIPRQGHPATSTANATENQPFAFSFQHAISSTPAHGMFMPSFPYPEPPQSPSPAGTNAAGFLSQQQPGRSDVFQAFGFPPPGRPSRVTGLRSTSGLAGGFIDPAALTRTRNDEVDDFPRAMEPGAQSGVGTSEASQMKRTMYGTELDGDTRFGDFGLEGVGNPSKGGFWAGGRF